MKSTKYFLTFFVLLISLANLYAQKSIAIAEVYEGIDFQMPKVEETSFPEQKVNLKDFGAKGDGIHKNTEAFKQAIQEIVKKGGGKVIVPEGIWLTGPIKLQSNVNLHLETGAIIRFSKDYGDYALKESTFEGKKTIRCTSPIYAENAKNIAITGKGIIDGSGEVWRPVKKGKMTTDQWNDLLTSGGVLSEDKKIWFPTEGAKKGYYSDTSKLEPSELENIKAFFRPVMISLVKCKIVLLDGPTFQNSPAWNIHPLMSEDVIIRNLSVRNPWFSQNGDGLDIESSKNVLVYNNTFDVGDDAICIKSGKNKDGRDRGIPTENVIIKNNIVYHGHGGFVVGSEMSGGVKNIAVSHCTFMGTDTGLRFKSTRGRGGVVENIFISDIYMTDIPVDAIRFNLFYGGKTPELENDKNSNNSDEEIFPVTEKTPSFKDIYMKNIYVDGAAQAGFFRGLPEMNLHNIHLENAIFKTEKGLTLIDAHQIDLKNVNIINTKAEAIVLYNSQKVKIDKLSFHENPSAAIKIMGEKSKNIQLSKSDFKNINTQINFDGNAKQSVLKIN